MRRNILNKLTVFAVGVLLLGCNSLDQEPTDRYTDKNFWNSADRAEMVLNMAYNQMWSHDKMWVDESLSDNMIEKRGTPDTQVIRQGRATPTTGIFANEWKWIFQGIKTCNVFMGNVDNVPDMDPVSKDRMKAEIRFIRAWLYFRLSNFYGDIPFFTEDITVEEARAMTRTPRAGVLAALHTELDEIIDALPSKDQLGVADNGRITKAAAMVLKIRMYLYEDDMVNVESYCAELMENPEVYGSYGLFSTAADGYDAYENLFTSEYEYNDEVILDYSSMTTVKEWNLFIDMVPLTVVGSRVSQRTPTQSLVDDYVMLETGMLYGKPADGTSTAYSYANRDKRLYNTVVYDGFVWRDKDAAGDVTSQTIRMTGNNNNAYTNANASATGYYVRKWFDPNHGVDLKMTTNPIIMRWADVLLMYAEACERNGTFTTETWDSTIRPIRQRAGFTSAATLDYPGGDILDIIKRERRCELAFEGLRYFDILRWEEGNTLLDGVVYGAKLESGGTGYIRVDTRSFSDRDELWSLPQTEMDKAPSLRPNNTGY